jgi:broad specificity phosphatase PhoE
LIDAFKEAGYGAWEGKYPSELRSERAEEYRQFYADPVNCRPKGAEPLDVFTQRVSLALSHVLEKYTHQNVLLVSHAGVMRAAMGYVLSMPLASQQQINIPFAGMYRIVDDPRGLRISIL